MSTWSRQPSTISRHSTWPRPETQEGEMTDFVTAECMIRQLQARYCDAVWRLDFEAFGDCFTETCEWRIGGAIIRGRKEIVEYNRTLFTTKFRRLLITLRTPILEVE